ncbi:MAG TPA: helix-turn-helix transcriptional regulator [Solirubrobacteraceae bacterium]|nr:helix-turn-helix transcriptional regulator [Solirubrobacteraceae bacterium]
MDDDELAGCLRVWRDRLRPGDAGLPSGERRRAPGLRREEVAQLAGLSVDYLTRLEQGRATNPSPSVLAPLARALRLSDDERDHLYRVAGHAEPRAGRIDRHITPGVQRVLDRLADVPVLVVDAAWHVVAANRLATALLGDLSGEPPRMRNILWRHFSGAASRVARSTEEEAAAEAESVADLRDALGRYPDDEGLRSLVDDLLRASPRFAELWEKRAVERRMASRKTFVHPEIGRITLDCDVLTVQGSELRLVVYTAPPGSPDAAALELLDAVGLQAF